ncbi:uroporphyrinogen-III synthase [Conchiformibius kuhniae]|uniref:Uroporphyrinogen-III synthase n=1 Tax=Conchiformibius kuhniae TaxID=211502 RepID=A0ABD8B8K0_9NEIS|nr:uroporphyrinogen-III synthase [Conchiformibius kuhniae]
MKPAVLLVRPEARLADDLAVCAAAGWRGVPFAPMALRPDAAALARLPEQAARAHALFWVSPSAVETARHTLAFSGSLKHVAVGAATARALQTAGAENIFYPENGKDSEAAMALPVWDRLPDNGRVLIVRGAGGRNLLAQYLRGRGLRVDFAEIYRRVPHPPDWSALARFAPCRAWLTSAQAAQMLFAQVPACHEQKLKSLFYLTHHPRIARAAADLGVARTAVAADLAHALMLPNTGTNHV